MKTITINSDRDYFVYGTGYTQRIMGKGVNSLRMNPSIWTETKVLIHKGIANYPAEIAEWDTVKSLKDNNHITISDCAETEPTDAETAVAVKNVSKAKTLQKQEKVAVDKENFHQKTLDELTDQLYLEQTKSLVKKVKEQNGDNE